MEFGLNAESVVSWGMILEVTSRIKGSHNVAVDNDPAELDTNLLPLVIGNKPRDFSSAYPKLLHTARIVDHPNAGHFDYYYVRFMNTSVWQRGDSLGFGGRVRVVAKHLWRVPSVLQRLYSNVSLMAARGGGSTRSSGSSISYDAATHMISFSPGTIDVMDGEGCQSGTIAPEYVGDPALACSLLISDIEVFLPQNSEGTYTCSGGSVQLIDTAGRFALEAIFDEFIIGNSSLSNSVNTLGIFTQTSDYNDEDTTQIDSVPVSVFLDDFVSVNCGGEGVDNWNNLSTGLSFTTETDLATVTAGFTVSATVPADIYIGGLTMYYPAFIMEPEFIDYPQWTKHCAPQSNYISIYNPGLVPLTYSVTVEEDPGVYSGWLDAPGFSGFLSAGEFMDAGEIITNAGGAICSPGTVVKETGRVIFTHDALGDVDTFDVSMIVADTVLPITWDTISTTCLALTVNNLGGAGNAGIGGVNMDYVQLDWRSGTDVYLYDASTVIGWTEGTDTVVNWSTHQIIPGDEVSFVPMGGDYHATVPGANIYVCNYATADTSLGIQTTWYAPSDNIYSCGFIIKETKVFAYPGRSRSNVAIGDIVDWNVPSDSSNDYNSSGTGYWLDPPVDNLVYQRGVEIPGYNDAEEIAQGGWDASERFGAIQFLRGYLYTGPEQTQTVQTNPHGMSTVSSQRFVDPYVLGFDPDSLFMLLSFSGSNISDTTGDIVTVSGDVTGLELSEFERNSDSASGEDRSQSGSDTVYYYTALMTTMNDDYPTAGGLSAIAQDAMAFFDQYLKHPGENLSCCINPGDFNGDDAVDIADLTGPTSVVAFMFLGGPGPLCFGEGDMDGNSSIDVADLTYLVAFMFSGGAKPLCSAVSAN